MGFDFSKILPLIVVVGAVVALIVVIALLAKNYIKVPPNKAAVFFGRKHLDKGFVVVTGGAKFKWPVIEDYQVMDMAAFQLKMPLKGIPNLDGVKVNIDAVATCKIKSDQASLNAAVERFLGKKDNDIHITVQENLEGQLRSVIGTMSIEQLIKDREALNNKVKSEADGELGKIGVGIDILNIQSITDDAGYIESLGKKRTAEVMRDASIGQANADKEAKQQATTAQKDGNVVAAQNDALTFEANKERDVKKATFDALVAAERARAEQAGPRSEAEAMQEVTKAQVGIEEARQRANIAVQEQMILVAEKEEQAKKVVPAEKEAAARVARAEGEKGATIKNAEAEKSKLVLEGEGQAARILAIGEAEGAAIKARLVGEAEGLMKKAEAYKQLDDAGQFQMILEKLPSILEKFPAIVREAAQPLSAIDKVVIIDSANGQSGMQKFAGQVPKNLGMLQEVMSQMGFDISGLLNKIGVTTKGLFDGTNETNTDKV
jgi:flotillin